MKIVIEGTPEEIADALKRLQSAPVQPVLPSPQVLPFDPKTVPYIPYVQPPAPPSWWPQIGDFPGWPNGIIIC